MALPRVSRPGRNPARVNSFIRCAPAFFVAGFEVWALSIVAAANAKQTVDVSAALFLTQDRIQPRLEIFFPFARQFASLDRQRRFYRFNPREQLLYVLSRFAVIFLQILAAAHPIAKHSLHRMIRTVEWI